jgi:hypothetical protein
VSLEQRPEWRDCWPGSDVGRIHAAAVELLDLKPDAILAMTPLTVAPLQQIRLRPASLPVSLDPAVT